MMKKTLFLSLIGLLLFGSISSTTQVSAQVSTELSLQNNLMNTLSGDYKINVLENTESYQKIQFVNMKTNEVEYLESFLENSEYVYEATNKDGKQTIIADEETITITDKANNKITLDKKQIAADVVMNQEITNMNTPQFQTYGLYDDVPKNTSWITYQSFKSSRALNVSTASAIAGILASIYGGPIIGVVLTAASFYAGIKADYSYYEITKQTRFQNGQRQVRNIVSYYKYHDYTGYLGTVYESPRNVCFSCLN